MFDRMLGPYLVRTGLLTQEQLDEVYATQEETRAKLGVIAVGEKLMNMAQAEEVNAAQALEDKLFGDIAVEKGYLTAEQLARIIEMQGNAFHTFSQVIADKRFLTMDDIKRATKDYQREHELLPRDMDALIAGDVDRITEMHLPTVTEEVQEILSLAVRNMVRLVDRHVSILRAEKVKQVQSDVLACQALTGDYDLTVMLYGDYEDLRNVAVSYTQEEFIETREDVLDAMSELINTNNGLFARDYVNNRGGSLEIKPPAFYTQGAAVSAKEIIVLPINIRDGRTNYAVAIGKDVEIKER